MLGWLVPVLVHSLRVLRSGASKWHQKLAWYTVQRVCTAIQAAAKMAPAEIPVGVLGGQETAKLYLAPCQPLRLRAEPDGEPTVAFIDVAGGLTTLSGGSFSAAFDALLGSFGFDQLDAHHHRAHQAATEFGDIAEYETALTSASGAFAQLRVKLLALKPTLTELAPLLLDPNADKKAQGVIDAITLELTKLLKAEKQPLLDAACASLEIGIKQARRTRSK